MNSSEFLKEKKIIFHYFKVKKLNKVARTKTASKKEHDSIHRLAQLAGLKHPHKTVHKVLKKRGYT